MNELLEENMTNITSADLHQQYCEACDGSTLAMLVDDISHHLLMLDDWSVTEQEGVAQLYKSYSFADFVSALAFTNELGALSERYDHHPAILLEWGRVSVRWWSHSLRGLHKNDFIMAAKTDRLLLEL